MALSLSSLSLFFIIFLLLRSHHPTSTAAATMWCVARSDASSEALLRGLNYACAAGADCTPLQTNGFCFLPNTVQAHASYAFNSYFQRRAMAPGSCNFAGTATIAKTDPSYGSCVYPSSLSTAGSTPSTTPLGGIPGTTTGNNPSTTMTPPTTTTMTPLDNGGAGTTNTEGSAGTSFKICVCTSLTIALSAVVLLFTF